MAGPGKEYIIGKGRLFFDQFAPGTKNSTGERYLGNTPELSVAVETETLDHYDADEGLNVKDESVTVENSQTLTFTTDNIDPDNIALWFAGPRNNLTITSSTDNVETHKAYLGRFIQLGASEETPSGARKVTNVTVSKLVPDADPENPPVETPVDPEGNLDIDLEMGRIFIEPDAPDLADGEELKVKFDIEAGTRTVIIGRGDEIRGALRFIATNPIGKKHHHYWPYVKITANGDYALKGSEWQQMSFNVEVLKKDAATERVYIDAAE